MPLGSCWRVRDTMILDSANRMKRLGLQHVVFKGNKRRYNAQEFLQVLLLHVLRTVLLHIFLPIDRLQ
jgi:hypothetical protein